MAQLGSSKVFGNLQVTGNIIAGTTITGTTLSISGTATAATFSGTLSGGLIASTQIVTIAGTSAAPAISPTGDSNTGMFFPSADTIAFAEGGVEAMRINSSGNVGVGTTTPETIRRNITVFDSGGGVVFTNSTSVKSALYSYETDSAGKVGTVSNHPFRIITNDQEKVTITTGGSVGIGTTNPSSKLHIEDTTPTLTLRDSRNITWSTGEQLGTISFSSADTSGIGIHETGFIRNINDYATAGNAQLAGALVFGSAEYNSAAVERMRITSSGNVGIGTTNPSTTLQVVGTITGTTFSGTLSGGGFLLNPSLTRVDSSQEGGQLNFNRPSDDTAYWILDTYGTSTAPSFRFLEMGSVTPRLQIDPGGAFKFNGSAGSSGQVLTSQGASSTPIWTTISGAGTVTSVAATVPTIMTISGTPVTSSGTLAFGLATQNANLVFAGPNTGAAATPTFRSLVAADIPNLGASYLPLSGGTLTGQLVISSGGASIVGAATFSTDINVSGMRIGRGAGAVSSNTAVGLLALQNNSAGSNNTGFGQYALNANTSGSGNVAIGSVVLWNSVNGNYNVGIGNNTLDYLSSGSNNIGIGRNAGTNLTTGSDNTIIGSLYGVTNMTSTVLLGAGTTERLKVNSTGVYVNGSTNNLNDALAIAWLGL